MNQVLAFFGTILLYILTFFLLQWIYFRIYRVKQLIFTFTAIAFISAMAVWLPFFYLTSSLFPDEITRVLLAFAGAYGSLGFSGTYIILGPISADRSLSAHICIQVLRSGGRMPEAKLRNAYSQDIIFNKRFDEYLDVGVMNREGDDLVLTAKGRRVAYIFLTFLKALHLKENF